MTYPMKKKSGSQGEQKVTLKTVAAHLGLSTGSVKQHLFRAVHELRKGIGKDL